MCSSDLYNLITEDYLGIPYRNFRTIADPTSISCTTTHPYLLNIPNMRRPCLIVWTMYPEQKSLDAIQAAFVEKGFEINTIGLMNFDQSCGLYFNTPATACPQYPDQITPENRMYLAGLSPIGIIQHLRFALHAPDCSDLFPMSPATTAAVSNVADLSVANNKSVNPSEYGVVINGNTYLNVQNIAPFNGTNPYATGTVAQIPIFITAAMSQPPYQAKDGPLAVSYPCGVLPLSMYANGIDAKVSRWYIKSDATLVYTELIGDSTMNQFFFPTIFGPPLCRPDFQMYVGVPNRIAYCLPSAKAASYVKCAYGQLGDLTKRSIAPSHIHDDITVYNVGDNAHPCTYLCTPKFYSAHGPRYASGNLPQLPNRAITVFPLYVPLSGTLNLSYQMMTNGGLSNTSNLLMNSFDGGVSSVNRGQTLAATITIPTGNNQNVAYTGANTGFVTFDQPEPLHTNVTMPVNAQVAGQWKDMMHDLWNMTLTRTVLYSNKSIVKADSTTTYQSYSQVGQVQ